MKGVYCYGISLCHFPERYSFNRSRRRERAIFICDLTVFTEMDSCVAISLYLRSSFLLRRNTCRHPSGSDSMPFSMIVGTILLKSLILFLKLKRIYILFATAEDKSKNESRHQYFNPDSQQVKYYSVQEIEYISFLFLWHDVPHDYIKKRSCHQSKQ